MNLKDLASNMGMGEDDFRELVELFITVTHSDINKLKKGIQNNNCQDAAAASHSIVGAAGNLGFDDIFNLAKDMEMRARQENLDGFEASVSELGAKVNTLKNLLF